MTDRELLNFFAEFLLLLGTLTTALYAVAILVAFVFQVFRSRWALYFSFVLSAVVSIPFVLCALVMLFVKRIGPDMGWLPDPLDDWPVLEWIRQDISLLLIEGLLLCFVWLAPSIQYRLLHRTPRAASEQAANRDLT